MFETISKICPNSVCGCFNAIIIEWSSSKTDYFVPKAKNIYHIALYRKKKKPADTSCRLVVFSKLEQFYGGVLEF
jgi:hypothetical protein